MSVADKDVWTVEISDKPNPVTQYTNVGRLLLNGKPKLVVTGWLQGCGLMGLNEFNTCQGMTAANADSLCEFLKTLDVYLRPDGGGYKARRYMFTTTKSPYYDSAFKKALQDRAEKLKTFENLAHGPNDITMYLLTV